MDQTSQYLNGVTDSLTSGITKWQAPLGFAFIDFIRRKAAIMLPMGNGATVDEFVRAAFQGLFSTINFRYWDNIKTL